MITWTDLVLADHRRVEELFATFQSEPDGIVAGQIIDCLTVHDQAEHGALYPIAAELLEDIGLVERALVAHSAVKRQIELIRNLEGPPLVAAMTELQALVEEHVAEEEQQLIPAMSERCSQAQAELLAGRFEQAKQRVG